MAARILDLSRTFVGSSAMPDCPSIGHDADRIIGLKLIEQQTERVLDQRQAILAFHRARDVHQEHEVGARPLGALQLVAFDGDVHQRFSAFHGLGITVTVGLNGTSAVVGRRIGIGEVIDQLLDPYGVLRRQTLPHSARGARSCRMRYRHRSRRWKPGSVATCLTGLMSLPSNLSRSSSCVASRARSSCSRRAISAATRCASYGPPPAPRAERCEKARPAE